MKVEGNKDSPSSSLFSDVDSPIGLQGSVRPSVLLRFSVDLLWISIFGSSESVVMIRRKSLIQGRAVVFDSEKCKFIPEDFIWLALLSRSPQARSSCSLGKLWKMFSRSGVSVFVRLWGEKFSGTFKLGSEEKLMRKWNVSLELKHVDGLKGTWQFGSFGSADGAAETVRLFLIFWSLLEEREAAKRQTDSKTRLNPE